VNTDIQVLATPGLGVGLICHRCRGEKSDLTSGSYRADYSLAELLALVAKHDKEHHS
jgi:hypothetical protein